MIGGKKSQLFHPGDAQEMEAFDPIPKSSLFGGFPLRQGGFPSALYHHPFCYLASFCPLLCLLDWRCNATPSLVLPACRQCLCGLICL
jgi:hypothetical protein